MLTPLTPNGKPEDFREDFLKFFDKMGLRHVVTPLLPKLAPPPKEPESPKPPPEEIFKDLFIYVETRCSKEDITGTFARRVIAHGAQVAPSVTKKVTHVLFKEGRLSTYKKAVQRNIPVVNILWVVESLKSGKRLPIDDYIVPEPSVEKKPKRFHLKMLHRLLSPEDLTWYRKYMKADSEPKRGRTNLTGSSKAKTGVSTSLPGPQVTAKQQDKKQLKRKRLFGSPADSPSKRQKYESTSKIKTTKVVSVESIFFPSKHRNSLEDFRLPRKQKHADLKLETNSNKSLEGVELFSGKTNAIKTSTDNSTASKNVQSITETTAKHFEVESHKDSDLGKPKDISEHPSTDNCLEDLVKARTKKTSEKVEDFSAAVEEKEVKSKSLNVDPCEDGSAEATTTGVKPLSKRRSVRNGMGINHPSVKRAQSERSCTAIVEAVKKSPDLENSTCRKLRSGAKIYRVSAFAVPDDANASSHQTKGSRQVAQNAHDEKSGHAEYCELSSIGRRAADMKITAKANFTPYIVTTSCSLSDQEAVSAIVVKLGHFCQGSEVGFDTTHLICGGKRRTIKVLLAVVRGCWVLPPEWVFKSLEAGCWLDEEPFELDHYFSSVKAYRLDRQSGRKSSLLSETGPFFICPTRSIPVTNLTMLITAVGGKVVTSPRLCRTVVDSTPETASRFAAKNCVSSKWILDCIMEREVLPMF